MPLPRPRPRESWRTYLARLMTTSQMKREFPDHRQRFAAIAATWRASRGTGGPKPAQKKKNPPLIVVTNPPTGQRVVATLGAPEAIQYQHAEDGEWYTHQFGAGDAIELLDDGTVRIKNTQGKRLFKRF